jgi:flavin-dependent dehydrogenase
MLAAGGDHIFETRFFEPGGRFVNVPSDWFADGGFALSLSRARMDHILLEAARDSGAHVLEETKVTGLLFDKDKVRGVRIRGPRGNTTEIDAAITVDATGRGRFLAKLAEKQSGTIRDRKPEFVGFKAHFTGVTMPRGVCEIYAFNGGYAGLSFVEGGEANLCFLARASLLNENTDADHVIAQLCRQNLRARKTLRSAEKTHDWIAVSVPKFGFSRQPALDGLYAVGDSAAFIDPFTGSGMLMAVESALLLSQCVTEAGLGNGDLRSLYSIRYREHFRRRLRLSGLLRRVAYNTTLGSAAVRMLSLSERVRSSLARRTRATGLRSRR